MTAALDIVVPALALRLPNGDIDVAATRRYAERAAATWVDYFIISGSTTRGQDLSPEQRADLLDLWLDVTDRRRLLACCWTPDDLEHATARDIAPMATMRQIDGHVAALAFLRQLPKGSYIYSHPMFGGVVFDAKLAAAAKNADVLPAGGKIAKISTADVEALSKVTRPDFKLWDGSSRRIQAALDAGAAGVVATPLCPFDIHLPAKEPALVQAATDPAQAALDALPDRASRTGELMRRATLVARHPGAASYRTEAGPKAGPEWDRSDGTSGTGTTPKRDRDRTKRDRDSGAGPDSFKSGTRPVDVR